MFSCGKTCEPVERAKLCFSLPLTLLFSVLERFIVIIHAWNDSKTIDHISIKSKVIVL